MSQKVDQRRKVKQVLPEFNAEAALSHFKAVDTTLHRLICEIGDYRLKLSSQFTPFQELMRSIVFQQLSGKAASSIYNRLLELYPNKRYPSAKNILETSDEALRSCGLSKSKIRAVKDLADKTNRRFLPSQKKIDSMDDHELVDAFTTVFGVGQWTVEMLMIFHLGRPDVLPANDLGIRRGFMVTYGLAQMPEPESVIDHGERWKPYRTMASWYLWRAADRATNRPQFR